MEGQPMSVELITSLTRIADALERIADQRDSMMAEVKDIEAEDKQEKGLQVGEILDVACAVCKIDILLRSRVTNYVWGRSAAMTAIRERLGWSLPMIGRLFEMDHSTVHKALVRFRQREIWSTAEHEPLADINPLPH